MSESDSTVPAGFRVIPGYPRYAINEHGVILSICRDAGGADREWRDARPLCPTSDRHGYQRVALCRDSRRHPFQVHTLVLMTFVGPCPDGMQCRHLDGNPANNHVLNLAWGTSLENQHDKILHGTVNHGENNGHAKLTKDDVKNIRLRLTNGEQHQSIASDFNVHAGTVSKIARRETWKHI